MKVPAWVTREVAEEVTGWSDRWLRKQCLLGNVQSRDTAKRGANGKPLREYLAASLPADAQKKLQHKFGGLSLLSPSDGGKGITTPSSATGSAAASLTPQPAADPNQLALLVMSPRTPEAPRVQLHGEAARKASERLSVLGPLLDFEKDPARYHHIARNKREMALVIARQHDIGERTLWRWHREYTTGGAVALGGRVRRDKGFSRWAMQHHEAAAIAAAHWMHDSKPSIQSALRLLEEQGENFGLDAKDLPSAETLRCFFNLDITDNFKLLAREGRRAYEARCMRYVDRDYADVAAGQIYVSDHMVHDVLVANDLFGGCDLDHMRLRLTMLMDFRSRRPVGYAWSEEGSSRSIATAFRHAFQNFGPCQYLYCDNGKDYKKVAKGASRYGIAGEWLAENLPDAGHGLLRRLGIGVMHCIPRHPQSKHVEREFGTIHAQFDKLWETYTGPDAVRVPDSARAALALHDKARKAGRPQSSPLPLASEFIAACRSWIETEYVHAVHRGKGMNGRSPEQAWREDRWCSQPSTPDATALAVLLCERTTALVKNDQVRANKIDYVPLAGDGEGNVALHRRNGRKLTIAFDPCDTAIAVALDSDGHLVCHLRRKPSAGMYAVQDEVAAADSKALIAESMQARAQLAKGDRDTIAALHRGAARAGVVPKISAFLPQRELPAAVGEHITHRPAKLQRTEICAPASAADISAQFLEAIK